MKSTASLAVLIGALAALPVAAQTSATAESGYLTPRLSNPCDEALFEYHFTSRIETVDLATGSRIPTAEPGLFMRVSDAPDSRHVLVERLGRPSSMENLLRMAGRPTGPEWRRDRGLSLR